MPKAYRLFFVSGLALRRKAFAAWTCPSRSLIFSSLTRPAITKIQLHTEGFCCIFPLTSVAIVTRGSKVKLCPEVLSQLDEIPKRISLVGMHIPNIPTTTLCEVGSSQRLGGAKKAVDERLQRRWWESIGDSRLTGKLA